MLEKRKRVIDNGAYVSALSMALSKVCDTINHDHMSTNSFNLMRSYLKNRKQIRINDKSSLERNTIAGVPRGSIDGTLLFNLFINDLGIFISYDVLSNGQ